MMVSGTSDMIQTTHVLLVAADPPARALVAQAIDAVGHTRLTIADSPGEARTLLNAHRYGLVIPTNLVIPPWLSIDVIPVDRTYEAMFLSGHWDDGLVRECEVRRLHRMRVPCDFDVLRDEIARSFQRFGLPPRHSTRRRRSSGCRSSHARQKNGRSYGRNSKRLRARCPVTPRRVYGAADRIRTGDVQLGKSI